MLRLVPRPASFPFHTGRPAPSLHPPTRLLRCHSQELCPHSLASVEPTRGASKGAREPAGLLASTPYRATSQVQGQSVPETEASIPQQGPSCFSWGSLSTLPSLDFISSCLSSCSAHPPSPVAPKELREPQSSPLNPLIQSAVISVQIKPLLRNPVFKAAHNPSPSFPSIRAPTHQGAASAWPGPGPGPHAPGALAICCCPQTPAPSPGRERAVSGHHGSGPRKRTRSGLPLFLTSETKARRAG